jgi:hypothetical protein
MKGVMTEGKFMAIVAEQPGFKRMNPDFRSCLIAGFYNIDDPCHFKNVHCVVGAATGNDLYQLFLHLDGKTGDDQVRGAVAHLLEEVAHLFFSNDHERVPRGVFRGAGWSHRCRDWVGLLVVGDAVAAT